MSHAPDSSMLHVGDVLAARYVLTERIGAGGMGRVFRARDEVLRRDVAIKVFFTDPSAEPDPLRRMSEARVLAALDHPSLVTLYDARLSGDDQVYLVMELITGPSLQRRLEEAEIPPAEVAGYLHDLATALGAVHHAGIVHRDVKPSNVLLRPMHQGPRSHEAVLADFGVAHLLDATRLTTPGTIIGTAAYLAPEQVRGETPQPASDIYALGLLTIEALTRLHPFGGGSLQETLLARLARQPTIPGHLGYEWRSLLAAMTAPDAAERPDARTVAERAATLMSSPPTASAPLASTGAAALDPALAETAPWAVPVAARATTAARPASDPASDSLDETAPWAVPVAASSTTDAVGRRRRARLMPASAAASHDALRRRWMWVGAAAGVVVVIGLPLLGLSLQAAGDTTTVGPPAPVPTVSESVAPAVDPAPAGTTAVQPAVNVPEESSGGSSRSVQTSPNETAVVPPAPADDTPLQIAEPETPAKQTDPPAKNASPNGTGPGSSNGNGSSNGKGTPGEKANGSENGTGPGSSNGKGANGKGANGKGANGKGATGAGKN
ncbi:protein kinase [Microbacterium sp. JC 701]|uniref:serine/threonine-protein kinase n=1 Tax=Microbacterium sp. JC 701 TaxID=2897389 RepID=UPI001E2D26D1|nr:serine/threonine-protein kinase [Microbacterium sp. JC 701]MCD2169929.1 protein kinase [Microbacterium sp. JC 701]